jgi:hypothetical protein
MIKIKNTLGLSIIDSCFFRINHNKFHVVVRKFKYKSKVYSELIEETIRATSEDQAQEHLFKMCLNKAKNKLK